MRATTKFLVIICMGLLYTSCGKSVGGCDSLNVGDVSKIPASALKELSMEYPEYTRAELCEVYQSNKEYFNIR